MAETSHPVGTPAAEPGQEAVVAFLSRASSYGPHVAPVEQIVTHAARIFLAGDEVYKIKRAVRYPYLDFSSLHARRIACERELEVNRPAAPGIYLGVVPIVRRRDGTLGIGGRGRAVEWAVHMRRFPTGALLSNLYASNAPGDEAVRALALTVADLHAKAPPIVTRDGDLPIGAIIEELQEALSQSAGFLPPGDLDRMILRLRQELQRGRQCLRLRGRLGSIRRCHGDLHLGNIVEIDGQPVVFDAIEFDEGLATIDTLYDLAFLIMDLDARGYRRAANLLLNRYLEATRAPLDLLGMRAFPLFMALRAGIRCMVAAERGAEDEARHYLDTALRHLEPAAPRLVAVGGLSGAGKSTLARALAPLVGRAPGAVQLRSDMERKGLLGARELERLDAAAYRPEMSAQVYRRLLGKARCLLSGGTTVIVDATFLGAADRTAFESLAARLRVPFYGLWLRVPGALAQERVESRGADVSDATPDVVARQMASAEAPEAWHALDATASLEATVAEALRILPAPAERPSPS